jgi:hypothetical protein
MAMDSSPFQIQYGYFLGITILFYSRSSFLIPSPTDFMALVIHQSSGENLDANFNRMARLL